jgi:general stress protein CsbA
LFKIILRLTKNRVLSFMAVLPFWLYPSAMIWYTQIHKDGYLIAGALLILLAWLRLGDAVTWKRWQNILISLVLMFAGALLAWIARPYSVQMMQGVSLAIVLLESYLFARRFWKREWRLWQTLMALVIVWASVAALSPFTVGGIKAEFSGQSGLERTTQQMASSTVILNMNKTIDVIFPKTGKKSVNGEEVCVFQRSFCLQVGYARQKFSNSKVRITASSNDNNSSANNRLSECNPPPPTWHHSGWPEFVETRAYALAIVRERSRICYPDAASNLDVQIAFHNMNDILLYLPRATEIAFLSPFPTEWFKPGSLPANTVMRRVSGFEMVGVYIALALLPYAVWRWRARPDLWIILIFCSGMMLIYGLVVANVGTLYRFRYGFLMTIVAVDLAAGFSFIQQWKSRKKPV